MTSTMAGSSIISLRVMASSCEMQNITSKSYTCFACHATKLFRLARNAKLPAACISSKKQSKLRRNFLRCEAYAGNCRTRERYTYNLYELLGIDAKASHQDIRQAYRWLQKRCHPDVAGEVGHDMAILLNEAYATLSDSQKRAAYDEMVAETKDLEDYTGQPLYSRWMGPASEDRAVFVDEIRCIGCLKCALIAPSTFSIENRFGRARAVAQWGDSEATIKDAIRACPVDCIWWVERRKLPALEFIMSKQPRIVAGAHGDSTGGARVADVFTAAEKFLKKSAEYQAKQDNLEEISAQREARMMAAEAIQARAGRWWHLIMGNRKLWESSQCSTEWNLNDPRAAQGAIIPLSWVISTRETSTGTPGNKSFSIPPKELAALFEAAALRRLGKSVEIPDRIDDEYWAPTERISCPVSFNMPSNTKAYKGSKVYEETYEGNSWADLLKVDNGLNLWLDRVMSTVPLIVAMVAAILVGFTSRPDAAFSKMDIVGPMPTEVSSSTALQVVFAAAVWYAVATATSRILWLITRLLIGSTKKIL